MRHLPFLFVLLCLALAPPANGELTFPTTSERAEAAAAVDFAIAETEGRIAGMERDLVDPNVFLLNADGRIVRVTSAYLDKLIAYARLRYFANPAELDGAIAAAARISGLPAFVIRDALADPTGFAGEAAVNFARKALRDRATADRPAIDAELAELKGLLAEAQALKADVAAAGAERDAAPCPMLAGAPLDPSRGIFITQFGDGRIYHPYPGQDFYCGYGTIHSSEFTGEHLRPDGEGYVGTFLDESGAVANTITYTKEGSETDAKGVMWSIGTWRNAANGQSGWYRASTFP